MSEDSPRFRWLQAQQKLAHEALTGLRGPDEHVVEGVPRQAVHSRIEWLGARLAALEKVVSVLRDTKRRIEADERYHYEPANVEINAPLALIQVGMKNQVCLCDEALAALDVAKEPAEKARRKARKA